MSSEFFFEMIISTIYGNHIQKWPNRTEHIPLYEVIDDLVTGDRCYSRN